MLYALLGGGYVNKNSELKPKKKKPTKNNRNLPPHHKTGHKTMPGEGEVAFEILTAATVKLLVRNSVNLQLLINMFKSNLFPLLLI